MQSSLVLREDDVWFGGEAFGIRVYTKSTKPMQLWFGEEKKWPRLLSLSPT